MASVPDLLEEPEVWLRTIQGNGSGVLVKTVLDCDEQDQIHQIASVAFGELNRKSLLRQGATRDELQAEMDNESVRKILLVEEEPRRIIGYVAVHTDYDQINWLNEEAKKTCYAEHSRAGRFYYNSSIEIDKDRRSLANAMLVLGAGARYLYEVTQAQVGMDPVIGFDYCKENDPGVPLLMVKSLKRQGLPLSVGHIARHNWFVCGDLQRMQPSEGVCDQQDFVAVGPDYAKTGGDLGENQTIYDPANPNQIRISELLEGDVVLERIHSGNPSIFSTSSPDFVCGGFWHLQGVDRLQTEDMSRSSLLSLARMIAMNLQSSDRVYIDASAQNYASVLSFWNSIRELMWPASGSIAIRDYQMYSIIHGGG